MSTKRKTGVEMAQELSDFVNIASPQEFENFARAVNSDHRTLQGDTFSLYLRCIRLWATDYRKGNFDERNKSACVLSHKFMETFDS